MNKLLFIDVETPNRKNASVCQVGALLVDSDMNILEEYNQLINPHEAFDPINTKIHGIAASDVFDCPCFKDFYLSKLKTLLDNATIINHNVLFDIDVLNKTICNYDLPFPSAVATIDTLAISRILYSDVKDYKLDTLCKINNIPLNHHNALSDARATYELYKIMRKNSNVLLYKGVKYYWKNTGHSQRSVSKALTPSMTDLYGFIVGIKLDSIINNSEIKQLKAWMQENKHYSSTPIFENVYQLLYTVIEDGMLTSNECRQILSFINPFIAYNRPPNTTQAENILKGIIRGIVADKRVNFNEAMGLLEWRNKYSHLRLNGAYEKLFNKVRKCLEDGTIVSEENQELIDACQYIINPTCSNDLHQGAFTTDLKGAIVVLTGEFDRDSRSNISMELEELGLIVANAVTKKTDYVIIGNKGSELYAHGKYGVKVEKAMNYNIPVVPEDDFFKMLEKQL